MSACSTKGLPSCAPSARGRSTWPALQQATGLPRATCHRLAVALEHHHLLRRDAAGRFCLGFELIRLGRVAADEFPLADAATPVLEALRDRTGESVQLYVREGDARRCIVSLPSPHALRWTVAQGALLPLGVGSAGRVLDRRAAASWPASRSASPAWRRSAPQWSIVTAPWSPR